MATFHPKLNTAECMEPMDPSKMTKIFLEKMDQGEVRPSLNSCVRFLGIRLSQINDEYMMYVVHVVEFPLKLVETLAH